ncbi:MAG: VanZ family protein [Bacteroidia bacterium]|nr:VanZ family protein [Bacteroidia bacterium]
MFRLLLSYKWATLWASLIFVLCAIPGRDLPDADWMRLFRLDKWVHAGMFIILLLLATAEHHRRTKHSLSLMWAVAGTLYGLGLELMQELVFTERSFDIFDSVADAAGAWMGWVFAPVILKKAGAWNGK